MNEIHAVIDRAGRRMLFNGFLRILAWTLAIALGALVLVRIVQKLVPFDVPWMWVFAGAAAAAIVAAAIVAFVRRQRPLAIAGVVDDRAGLRESLSTALTVEQTHDGWSENVVEMARTSARRVVMRDAIPIAVPRAWAGAAVAALALLAVWWLPRYDITGLFERKEVQVAQQMEIRQVKAQVKANDDKLKTMLEKAGVKVEEDGETVEAGEELDPNAPITPEAIKRLAVKRLTKLADELETKAESEKGAQLQAMQDAMRRLKAPSPGPASQMAREMAKGDFAQAKAELEKMAEQIASGEMSASDKKTAAKQLQQLAKQMDQLAKNKQQLEEQLQAAGYSKEQAQQMASSQDEMQKQLDKNDQMSDQQKQQMQQQAKAQQQASDAMSAMSQAMGQMSQGMQQQSGQQAMGGAESMSSQLGQMEMAQADMASAQAAMDEVQRQLDQMGQGMCEGGQCSGMGNKPGGGQGQWAQGGTMRQGSGTGGPGKGLGGSTGSSPGDYTLERHKAEVNTTDGPVIASTLVYGQQVKGESKATFGTAVASGQAEAAEAIETRRVPRKHEAAVQHYFGRLERIAGSGGDAEGKEEKKEEGTD